MSELRTVKIFLASSVSETQLREERDLLGTFFNQLNRMLVAHGVFFEVIDCTEFDRAMQLGGKQAQLNGELERSDIALFLFRKKVGRYTRVEFDAAWEAFRAHGRPRILTFFRACGETTEEIAAFQRELSEVYHHYYQRYDRIDALKFALLMQLVGMLPDGPILPACEGQNLLTAATRMKRLAMDSAPQTAEKSPEDFSDVLARLEGKDLDARIEETENEATMSQSMLQNIVDELLFRAEISESKYGPNEKVSALYAQAYELIMRHSLDLRPLYEYACYLQECGRFEEALHVAQTLNERLPAADGSVTRSETALILDLIGNLYTLLKQYDEAVKFLGAALAIFHDFADRNRAYVPYLALGYHDLGTAEMGRGKVAAARSYLEHALSMRRILYGLDADCYRFDLAETLNNLGLLHVKCGDLQSAETYLREADALFTVLAECAPGYSFYRDGVRHNLELLQSA